MAKKKNKASASDANAGSKSDYLADVPTNVVSGTMGLMGFAITSFIGLWAGNSALTTLGRALIACAICAIVGRVIGWVGEACVKEFIKDYREQNPTPELPKELQALNLSRAAHERIVDEVRKKAA